MSDFAQISQNLRSKKIIPGHNKIDNIGNPYLH